MTTRALFPVIVLLGLAIGSIPPSGPVRVVTYNIRFDNPADGLDAWPNRRARVAEILDSLDADVIGIQEALKGQIQYLAGRMPAYAWVGVGRDDGRSGGEFSPVFYRRDRFDLLEWGTVWLSQTPDSAGSVGWDAALPRIATWLRLRPVGSERSFLTVNTHFDHVGTLARLRSAELIRRLYTGSEGLEPAILLGDLNVTDSTRAYGALTEGPGALLDTRFATDPRGPAGTFTGFDYSADRRIDYVFASGHWRVESFATLEPVRAGRPASDHRPVVVDLALR